MASKFTLSILFILTAFSVSIGQDINVGITYIKGSTSVCTNSAYNHEIQLVNYGADTVLNLPYTIASPTDTVRSRIKTTVAKGDTAFVNLAWFETGKTDGPQLLKVTLDTTDASSWNNETFIPLKVLNRPKADWEAQDICEGDSIEFFDKSWFDATHTPTYAWIVSGDTITSRNYSRATAIMHKTRALTTSLVVTTADVCSDTLVKTIIVNGSADPYFTASLKGRNLIIGSQATTSNDVTYNWRFGDGGRSSDITPTYSYSRIEDSVTVCLGIMTGQACISEHCVVLYPTFSVKNVGAYEVSVVPTLVENSLRLRNVLSPKQSTVVMNMLGQTFVLEATSNGSFNAASLKPGKYFIQAEIDGAFVHVPFIKR